MNPADILEFARRDHEAARDAKRRFWTSAFREGGAHRTWQAAQALLEHVRGVQPGYPTHADRERDLADHLDLKRRIDGAAHAFARR